MNAAEEAAGDADVLLRLRTATAGDHARVEQALDLLDPRLTVGKLESALDRLHGFWVAAEAGLDGWADREPAAADAVTWPARRRARLFAADLTGLGRPPSAAEPHLTAVNGTDDALGRLYVLEGSSLGGRFIDHHLATLPAFAGVRLRAFSPYGADTGRVWHAFRRAVRQRVADGGDGDRMVRAAVATFASLAEWCTADVAQEVPA